MPKNKKIIIIVTALLAVVIILGAAFLIDKNLRLSGQSPNAQSSLNQQNLPAPQFLTATEKAQFRISPDLKVQVIQRNASGTVTVYKIIKNNSDLVADPSKIAPISPNHINPTK